MKIINTTKYFFFVFLIFLLGTPEISKAQDPSFTQFTALPMTLNPALTGSAPSYRFVTAYRKGQIKIPKAFETNLISFDYNLSNYNSGIGVQIMLDKSAAINYKATSINLSYAYVVRLSQITAVRMGLQMGFISQNRDLGSLRFGDQIASGNATQENFDNTTRNFADFSSGFLLYNKNAWLGMSFIHFNQKYKDLAAQSIEQKMRFSLHGGYKILISGYVNQDEFIAPAFSLERQVQTTRFSLGANYSKKALTLGVWYKSESYTTFNENIFTTSLAVIAGVRVKEMNFRYSYDIGIAGKEAVGGSHEITLKYAPRIYKGNADFILSPIY